MPSINSTLIDIIVYICFFVALVISAWIANKKGFFQELKTTGGIPAAKKFLYWLFGVWVAGFIAILLLLFVVDMTR